MAGPIVHSVTLAQVVYYAKIQLGINLNLNSNIDIIEIYKAFQPDLERQNASYNPTTGEGSLRNKINQCFDMMKTEKGYVDGVCQLCHFILDCFTMGHMTRKSVEILFEPIGETVSKKDGYSTNILNTTGTIDTFYDMVTDQIKIFYSKYKKLADNPVSTLLFKKSKFNEMIRYSVRITRELAICAIQVCEHDFSGIF